MKPTAELFELIQSLSRTEKGYFKKFASLHVKGEENNYIKLFDAIEVQKEYDEEAIKKKFAGETFIKHLPSEKNYLQQLIMKSLRLYHAKTNVGKELRELIDYIEICMEKGLYRQCEKLILKGKKIAEAHERFMTIAELTKLDKKLEVTRGNALNRKKTEQLQKEISTAIKNELEIQDFFKMQDEMIAILEITGEARSEEDAELANDRIKALKKIDITKVKTTLSCILYYNTLAAYYYFIGDYENSYKCSKLYLSSAKLDYQRTGDSANIINGLHNHYTSCYRTKRFDECYELIDEIKAVPVTSARGGEASFSRILSIELGLAISTGKFKEAVPIIENASEKILNMKYRMPLTAYFNTLYIIAHVYFGAGKYSESLKWLNRIINDTDADDVQYIFCASKILSLIIHTDMGKSDSLEYIVKPTYRYLYKRKRLYKFESRLLNFIKSDIPKIHGKTELINAFKEFHDDLVKLNNDPFERRVFEYFDFISWLESKIENRPFDEIVCEKAAKEKQKNKPALTAQAQK